MAVVETAHPYVTVRNWCASLHLTIRKPVGVDWYTITAHNGQIVFEGDYDDTEMFVAVARDQNRGYSPVPELDASKLREAP